MVPEVSLHPLNRADGSATYSSGTHTILAAVNGPVEVQRRDELPAEAAVEVNIRPSKGVGNVKERWLESLVHDTLRHVILTHMHPRTLVQVSLQVLKEPSAKKGADLAVLPALLNASLLALVDAAIPLSTSYTAILASVSESGQLDLQPTTRDISRAQSLHAFVFAQSGAMLLTQSSGPFDFQTWDMVAARAKTHCLNAIGSSTQLSEDEAMADDAENDKAWLRTTVEKKAYEQSAWKNGI